MSDGLHLDGGVEWVVDAHGCDPARLQQLAPLQALFARAVAELGLRPLAEPIWHAFGGHGGVSGVLLLAESHLACHTFPEASFATLNLYCCRPRPEWDFAARLREAVGATRVEVRKLSRGPGSPAGKPGSSGGQP